MAAIVHPDLLTTRPSLRLVPPLGPTRADYARRRLAALVLVLLVAVVAVRLLAGLATASDTVTTRSPAAPAVTVHSPLAYGASGTPVPAGATYVVQPGDTVWSIAEQLSPGADVRAAVDHLVSLNGSAALEVGQHLLLA
ncbi:MAG: hypothetical protein QOF97_931 [Acidimicrobiaceae bacterium]